MFHFLHLKALELVKKYFLCESQLIGVLQEIGRTKLFKEWGFSSLFHYATEALKLTESQAYTLINVARKCDEVPELKLAIDSGELSASKARRIVPVLDKSNAVEWIQKAIELPKRVLERAVVAKNPEIQIRETIKPVFANRSELRCGMTLEMEEKLERARTLVAQSTGKQCSIEEALNRALDVLLEHKDPIKKAERAQERAKKVAPPPIKSTINVGRQPLPMALRHEIWLRDHGRCQAHGKSGNKCGSTQWVEVHHRLPVSRGGGNSKDNLITLCRYHHDQEHGFARATYMKRFRSNLAQAK